MDYKKRIRDLRLELKKKNLDGILITEKYNRRYLSGFTGSFGVLFIDPKNTIICTDSRYYIQVKNQCPDFNLLRMGKLTTFNAIMDALSLKGKSIGFESDSVTVTQLKAMRKAFSGVKLVPTEQLMILLRSIKEHDEIKLIQTAQKITDSCFTMLLDKVQPGMTEIEIAWMMEKFMREKGAEAIAFDTIVASGPNSALPHAVPTSRKIKKGEPLLFDFGARVNGYNSDMTRTIFVGDPSCKMQLVYNRVLETHLMVFELSHPGTFVADIDKISRDYVYKTRFNNKLLMGEGKGQGRYEHGLGHGVGLEVHEQPVLSQKLKKDVLKPGHIVTNEPGIYIEGEGGVRIEDMMYVTKDGVESLTRSPKELLVI